MLLQNGMAAPVRREGVINLYELCGEYETQMNRNQQIRISNVKAAFPRLMIELTGFFDEDSNDDSKGFTHYLYQKCEWIELHMVTAKDMQLTLKEVMNKIDVQNFDHRLGIVGYDSTQIGKFRKQC